MGYLDVLYGIDNPAFLDMKEDRAYLIKEILPWMVKYLLTFRKIEALNEPVIDYLRNYTQNQSLLDIIAQHFFQATPTFFALSYFKLYLDYNYPPGVQGSCRKSWWNLSLHSRGPSGTTQKSSLLTRRNEL